MTSEAILVDITDNVGKNVKRGRNSFYSLPKTLSEDDDPFGLFQNPRTDKHQSVGEGGLMMGSVTEKEEPNTGLLVQIETESPRISISESFNSVSSRNSISGTGVGMLGLSGLSVTGASSVSGMSLNIAGASFGNISRVSSNVTGSSAMLSDDVFTQDVTSTEDEPNWDKLLNEAQFVALKISDPVVPVKTPLSRSTTTAKLRNFSPGDMIDSPSGGMLMDSKDYPEAFLVQLTPESSPKRRSPADLEITASPALDRKPSISKPLVETVNEPLKNSSIMRTKIEDIKDKEEPETNPKTKQVNSSGETPTRGLDSVEIKKTDGIAKKMTTPVRKSVKENIKPRVIDNAESKKASGPLSSVKPVTKSRIGLKLPSSEVKRPSISSTLKQPQSETKRIPLSKRPAPTVPVTPSSESEDNSFRGSSINQSAAKTLQFTPKNSVPRAPRRESISAIKAPLTKPALTAHQFKLPSKTTDAHLKKIVAPARTGRLQPTRLSLAPSSSSSSAGSSSLAQPRQAPLKPQGSGALSKSGLQRPGLYRQGSALCQSLITGSRAAGSKLTTPVMSRVRRPSDVGLRSAGGTGLPSPQVLNKNSSIICSTPTVVGQKQSRDRALPSPITTVKRRV